MESTTDLARKIMVILFSGNKEGRMESLPEQLPDWFKFLLGPFTPMGIARIVSKYNIDLDSIDLYRQMLKDRYQEISTKVEPGKYFLDNFSYADIMIALSLQNLKPVADDFVESKPIFRMFNTQNYCEEDWAKKLLAYRDFISNNHWPR